MCRYECGLDMDGMQAGGASAPDGDAPAYPAFSLPGDVAHYAPDRLLDIRHVDLHITPDFDARAIRGDVTTWGTVLAEELRVFALDAAELAVEAVTLAGGDETTLDFWTEGERLYMRLDRAYRYGEELGVRVRYQARPRQGFVFIGPTAGDPGLPVQAWTTGETQYHHHWFPCHDFPNQRSTFALRATVPGNMFALSNGRLEGVSDEANGRKTYAWRMEQPIPAYLVTLVVGEFSEVADRWRGRPVNGYVPRGREADGRRVFAQTPAMLEFFSERTGVAYPYDKYAQVIVEGYAGSTENASATTHSYWNLTDERASLDHSPARIVAHELAHQWYGDLIAVRDWSHLWLKEGFATYFESLWREHDEGEDEFRAEMHGALRAYLEADKRGRRPIVYNVYRKNAWEFYDRHAYEKGARVLHLLRFTLGEEPFWRAVRLYTQRHAGREVITPDLERAIEESTGRSMARFFAQWVYGAGHPAFAVSYSWDDERRMAKLTVRQTQQVTEKTPIFVTPVEIGFFVPKGAAKDNEEDAEAELVTVRVTVDAAEQTFYLPLARRPLSVRFDQGGWVPKTLEFARPSALLRYQLRHDPDVLGRIEAAEALGQLGDEQSTEALVTALTEEPFWAVRAAIAEALGRQKSARALEALLAGLERISEPKARRALVAALGEFRALEQPELAARAAEALARLLEQGEASYYVEAAAATALGKTRAPGAYERLLPLLERSSWLEIVRGGVFAGLGELGDPRAVAVLAAWLTDRARPAEARRGAAGGLRAAGATGRIEGEAKVRAVDALLAALDDPWELVQGTAVAALRAWGDARALPALRRLAETSLNERMVRQARETVAALERASGRGEATRRMRDDLDALREENRALRARLDGLEARATS